jgi:23S rRNA maturation mini-RNase III
LFITSLPGEARFCQDTLADLHYKAVFLSSAVKQIQHLESSRERLVQDNKTLETRVDILKDGLNAESALSEEVEVDSERESSGLCLLGQR